LTTHPLQLESLRDRALSEAHASYDNPLKETGRDDGAQLVAGRFREALCLDAAEIIENRAGYLTPIDPM
jgi:hypothetical protein